MKEYPIVHIGEEGFTVIYLPKNEAEAVRIEMLWVQIIKNGWN